MQIQKQISQEYNYPISQSHASQSQYIQPAYNPIPYGLETRQSQEFTGNHKMFI